MLIDYDLEMCKKQAITADARSAYYIDAKKAGDAFPTNGRWIVQVNEDFNNVTSLTFKLRTDPANDFSTGPTVLAEKTVVLADLEEDTIVVDMPIPAGILRYVDTYIDVTGTNPSTGKVTSFITPDPGKNERASDYT
jgi:hypothetical protein